MSTNVSISLDKRRPKRDGSYPIVLRLSHYRKTFSIQTGYSVPEQEWDEKRRQVKKTFKGVNSVTRLNHHLSKMKTDAMEKVKDLEEKDLLRDLSTRELKALLTQKENSASFFVFSQQLIEDMRKAKKVGNARIYEIVRQVMRNYCREKGKTDLQFRDINYKFLKQLEHAHLAKGNSINSLSVYLRTLRAIYNKAIKQKIIEREHYPFYEYKIQSEPTQKRAISKEELQRIVALELDESTKLFHYRNYFLASYLLWGISFMDLAFLRLENLNGDRVQYRRRKTAKLYNIRLSDQLKALLGFYLQDKNPQDFIFPIIKRENLEDQYKDIKWERKRYNRGLHKLGELCGIDQKLTSYVARHSFATQALLNEVPLKAISEMLGHSSLNTTQVYLKSLPTNVLDEYADRLGF